MGTDWVSLDMILVIREESAGHGIYLAADWTMDSFIGAGANLLRIHGDDFDTPKN